MTLIHVPYTLPLHPYGRQGHWHAHRIPRSGLCIYTAERFDLLAGLVARATPVYPSGRELGGVLLTRPAADEGEVQAEGYLQIYRGEFVLPVNRVAVHLAVSASEQTITTLLIHVAAPEPLMLTAPTGQHLTDTSIRQYGDHHDCDFTEARRALEEIVNRARLAQHRADAVKMAPPVMAIWTASVRGHLHNLLCKADGTVIAYRA